MGAKENYHNTYYERNKDYLRAYQRAYYYRKKNSKMQPIPRKKKDLSMRRYYGTFTIHFD